MTQTNVREPLTRVRRLVIKIGSALLTNPADAATFEAGTAAGVDRTGIGDWVAQMAGLRARGIAVLLVTSGAVAVGMQRMRRKMRPHALYELQAMAAIGQMGLVQTYESAFQRHGLHTAQVLLTHDDLANRRRYLNARSTLRALLDLGVVPVVNENDTVATEEIRFGDNDTLAAMVTSLVEADLLLILTDQAGLFERDPRRDPAAKLITEAQAGDPALIEMAGASGIFGRGGMRTKLLAAQRAGRSGAATVIASGREPDVVTRVLNGELLGTYLRPTQGRLAARKQWLAGQAQVRGRLVLDEGAARVVRESGKSLLPVGVKAVEGVFTRGEVVACVDPQGHEIARGLVNYSSEEALRIIGRSSDRIESILGYVDEPELVHRDNMVLLQGP